MRKKKKRFYAVPCMIAIAVLAAAVTAGGYILRRTLLADLPQYDGAPDIAIPMMLLQDSGPLREARERAAWEAAQGDEALEALTLDAAPAAEAPVESAFTPAEPAAEIAAEPETNAETVATVIETAQAVEAAPIEVIVPVTEPAPEAGAAAETVAVEASAELAEAVPAAEEMPLAPEPQPIVVDEALPAAEEEDLPEWLNEEAEPASAEAAATAEVDESYFDKTLFIGDSKTDGMRMWGRLGQAQYFCGTSYSVYNIFDKTASDSDFKKAKLDSVLASHKYDQIYILLGYNECGYPYSSLMKQFKYVIKRVHDAQPQARIILHGIMHASARVAAKYDYYTVKNIEKVNDGLRELAASVDGLYYVDCNAPFCDEEGFLLSKVSTDGEHLTPDYTKQWAQEIRKRAIVER